MTMISFEALSVSFGAQQVLCSISGNIGHGQRIGLVGENGAGKTTLLRALLNEVEDMSGNVSRANGIHVALLGQEMAYTVSDTVLSWVVDGQGLTNDPGLKRQAEHMLREVGIYDALFTRPLAHLSGGQRTRVSLARVLTGAPDLLLLDEPTNFLDMDTMHWLAGFLKRYNGSALIVTHDRYFLDQVAEYMWELSRGRLAVYRGNYSSYRRQKKQREELANNIRQQALAKREQLVRVIGSLRYRYDTAHAQAIAAENKKEIPYRRARAKKHARQLKARIKQLQRLEGGMPEEAYEPHKPKISFPTMDIGSDNLLILEGISFSYNAEFPLLKKITASVKPGERIGLLGTNGTGKTTLLRMIMQELRPTAGVIKTNPSLRIGYLPQDLWGVPMEVSAATWLSVRLGVSSQTARRFLGRVNVTQDEALKPLGHLSMGQRYRALIAALLAQEVGLLILDEPTNYLDLWARESVEQALRAFPGALLLVSHDRYFLESITTKLWVIEDCTLIPFAGKISAYQEWRRIEANPERKARHLERMHLREQSMVLEMRMAKIASLLQRSSPQSEDWRILDERYTTVALKLNEVKDSLARLSK